MTYTINIHFPIRKSFEHFFHPWIASNKQRYDQNNLATIWRKKLNGANKHSKSLSLEERKTQMQTPTIMDIVVIGEYYYVPTMNDKVNEMKLPHCCQKNPKPWGTLLYIYFTLKILMALFKHTHQRNNASPLCISL